MRDCPGHLLGVLLAVCSSLQAPAAAESDLPFWESFPRIVETPRLEEALEHHATIGLNGAQTDPGWGLHAQKNGSHPDRIEEFRKAGLTSLSYFETFGQSYCFVAEIGSEKRGDFFPIRTGHWSWPRYRGGPIVWMGAHQYFDDLPLSRPYTRTHPRYGARPATYPDGTVASGYIGATTDPRKSRVFDAICCKNVLGQLVYETYYNEKVNRIDPTTGKPAGPIDGLLFVPETGKYASLFMFKKDAACPAWIDYARASTLMAADAGLDGMWTDNFGPWDSFGHRPVRIAFGEWSVARFRDYLKTAFADSRLREMGVQDLETFDIRESLRKIATEWGWDGKDLAAPVWRDRRWLDEPLWRAYRIFKRRTGTEALTAYDRTVKSAAREAGKEDFLVAGNDIPGFSLGWPRGNLDMVSTEWSAGWGISRGARGFGLPPFGRFAPVYKLAREHARSRFVNIWFYRDHFEEPLSNQKLVSLLYYEMLANHTLPMFHPRLERVTGSLETNSAFFRFVSRVAPIYGDREPVEEVGLYYSSSSILSQFTPGGLPDLNNQPHQFAFWGWATALGELHVQYRAVPEWKLNAETLSDLSLLIVPDSEVLDPSVVERVLLPWVRENGGRLIVTGDTGARLGEAGNFDRNPAGSSVSALIGVPSPEEIPKQRLHPLGKGQVLYLRSRLGFDFYMAENQDDRIKRLPRFRDLLETILNDSPPPVLEVLEGNSPQGGVTLYRSARQNRLFLDIVNFGIDVSNDSIQNLDPVTISLHLPDFMRNAPLEAKAVAPDSTPEVEIVRVSESRLGLSIGPVRLYAGVIVSVTGR